VSLRELINSQLAPVGQHDERISLKGPPIAVTAPAAQTLGMALHELATNASKYGALTKREGGIEVFWDVRADRQREEQFIMSWREIDGPLVKVPTRRGFGSTVIIEMTRVSLDGQVTVDYRRSGVVWQLTCPARNVIDGESTASPTPLRHGHYPSEDTDRKRILVVEDEALISMEIASILASAGFEILGPASTVAQALDLLDRSACDAAVLDVNLGKETAEPIARFLAANGKPFITVSGYAREQQPAVFRDSLLLPKPLRSDMLIDAVNQCFVSDGRLKALHPTY
jgi:CheY-like chemotaxis protein